MRVQVVEGGSDTHFLEERPARLHTPQGRVCLLQLQVTIAQVQASQILFEKHVGIFPGQADDFLKIAHRFAVFLAVVIGSTPVVQVDVFLVGHHLVEVMSGKVEIVVALLKVA